MTATRIRFAIARPTPGVPADAAPREEVFEAEIQPAAAEGPVPHLGEGARDQVREDLLHPPFREGPRG
jgi:hypothetical protein